MGSDEAAVIVYYIKIKNYIINIFEHFECSGRKNFITELRGGITKLGVRYFCVS